MTGFVPPSWWMGLLIQIGYYAIPIIIGIILFIICLVKDKATLAPIVLVVCIILAGVSGTILWWENFEVASVQSEVVTVDSWQPRPGINTNENGMMVIDNANQLMLITSTGEGFLNTENFLFQKFDTRDILNTAKPGSKINITYYGWRNGFNSGFPNILNVTVIDDSNASNTTINDYFGTKFIG